MIKQICMTIILLLSSVASLETLGKKHFVVSSAIRQKEILREHVGSGPFQRSLQMNINFSPVKNLFHQLDNELQGHLNKSQARTEAHITIGYTKKDLHIRLHRVVKNMKSCAYDIKI